MSAPRYWLLVPGGYTDTRGDYLGADSIAHAKALTRRFYDGYMDNQGTHVFDGRREPWTEDDDPYPDWCIDEGPRGGMTWARA